VKIDEGIAERLNRAAEKSFQRIKPLYIHRWRSGLNAVTIQTIF
jgi:hypothetical protein